jgi:hypothetical protein
VIGTDGLVKFADVHPNWMVRTEAATIIEVVRGLRSRQRTARASVPPARLVSRPVSA